VSPKRLFRFSYMSTQKEDRPLHPHQVRDGDACLELAGALATRGYEYGGIIFNHSPSESGDPSRGLLRVLTPSDLLVLTTRPPLDDRVYKQKKVVIRSGSFFEKEVLFPALRGYFDYCSRLEVCLTSKIAAKLAAGYKNRAMLEFRANSTASYKSTGAYEKVDGQIPWGDLTTAVYLVHTSELWPGGPQLLATFGLSGAASLIWAYLLRTKFSQLLEGQRFVMAEVTRTGPLPTEPLDLRFCDEWLVKIITEDAA
jgi:hypothetical protein